MIIEVKIATPIGEYPFEFRRVELRHGRLLIIGIIGGLESSVILDRGDLRLTRSRSAVLVAVLLVTWLLARR